MLDGWGTVMWVVSICCWRCVERMDGRDDFYAERGYIH